MPSCTSGLAEEGKCKGESRGQEQVEEMGEAKAGGLQSSPKDRQALMSLLFPGPQSQGPSGQGWPTPKVAIS